MALAAVRRPRAVIRPRALAAITALLIPAVVSACGGGHPAPESPPPSAASTSSAPANLSNVLIQPAGFTAMPNDTTSGPLQTPDDVRRFFTDRPADPGEILSHGFKGGYIREWQMPQSPSSSGNNVVVAPILLKIVLQFDTAAHALTVEQYFRHAPSLWPVAEFAVPSQLAAGYGQYQVQGSGSATSYLYAVVWVSHGRVFEVGIEYSAPQRSPAQVVSVAVAQSRASP